MFPEALAIQLVVLPEGLLKFANCLDPNDQDELEWGPCIRHFHTALGGSYSNLLSTEDVRSQGYAICLDRCKILPALSNRNPSLVFRRKKKRSPCNRDKPSRFFSGERVLMRVRAYWYLMSRLGSSFFSSSAHRSRILCASPIPASSGGEKNEEASSPPRFAGNCCRV